jgi:hypothetical protein
VDTWFYKNLGDAMLASELLEKVRQLFIVSYSSRTRHAIFFRHQSDGRLHCEVVLYFSPSTSALANTLEAIPCARPAATGLGLLIGDASLIAAQ